MKPVCYGGLLSLASLASILFTHLLKPLMNHPFFSYFLSVSLTIFFIIFILSISAGNNAQKMSKDFPLQFRLAAQFRTPVLMFIVIPLSYLRWLHTSLCDWYRYHLKSFQSQDTHEERVHTIIQQVKEWNKNGRKSNMRTARPNWASMSTKLSSNKGDSNRIATTHLSHILNLNEEELTITCEPSVTMGQITHHLLPKGYALLVQVEMESITIGGVSMGFGMETNSHLVGFFQESVVEYEIVNPQGELMKINKQTDPEIFYALPWSCGTMGFLVSVKVKISKVSHKVALITLPRLTHLLSRLCLSLSVSLSVSLSLSLSPCLCLSWL
jgi:Delta24-sterol reductase